MYDLIIIGGGPAGVGAGVYAARKMLKTLLLTKDFGGQSVNSAKIENFIGHTAISGVDLAKALEEHLRAQSGIEVKDGVFVSSIAKEGDIFRVTDSTGAVYESKTVLYTLGSSYKRLNVPGEKEYEGKGVFYCSICDAPLMKNKKAAVIGGGNSGLEAVIDLLPYASEIYLLNHGPALKGDFEYQEKIKKESKVHILANAETKEIFGDTLVNGLEYENLETGEKIRLDVSGVFVQIGWRPNSDPIKNLAKTDDYGHVIVDHKTFQTSCPGLWAAGDVTDALYAQINPAIGDAIKAALNIYDTLQAQKK